MVVLMKMLTAVAVMKLRQCLQFLALLEERTELVLNYMWVLISVLVIIVNSNEVCLNDLQRSGQQEIEKSTARAVVDVLLSSHNLKSDLQEKFMECFLVKEKGGWIFVKEGALKYLCNLKEDDIILTFAQDSASEFIRPSNTSEVLCIDLENIEREGVPHGYVLVATFHFHPLTKNEEPSEADKQNSWERGVIGLVLS